MRSPRFVAAEMPPKSRVEALVDGIFSVSMTLLVLDIKLPDGAQFSSSDDLARHFLAVAAAFAIYVVSFMVLAMFWVAHHYQFRYVKRLDRRLLWINLGFLLLTTTVPFTTNLVGTHGDLSFAVALYAANLLLLALALMLHNRRLMQERSLTTDEYTTAIGLAIRTRLALVCVIAALAIGAAQVVPRMALNLFWLLALLHFAPHARARESDGDAVPIDKKER